MAWLQSFREATTQMSTTKQSMLSTTHAVFRGLQDDIKNILKDLPDDVDPTLKNGLVEAHRKLSDYFLKFDKSDYYHWAARKFFCLHYQLYLKYPAVLDPRISYTMLLEDYKDDPDLHAALEWLRLILRPTSIFTTTHLQTLPIQVELRQTTRNLQKRILLRVTPRNEAWRQQREMSFGIILGRRVSLPALRLLILSSGGMSVERHFQISIALSVMCSVSLVSPNRSHPCAHVEVFS